MKDKANRKAEWSNLESDQIIYARYKLDYISRSIFITKSHPHVAAQLWSHNNILLNRSNSPPASFDSSISPDTLSVAVTS